jgi:hypothetical protein
MKNKALLGLGALALVGVVVYFNRKNKNEKTSSFRGRVSSSSCSSDNECKSPEVCYEGRCTILKQHPPILSYSNIKGRFVNTGVGVYNTSQRVNCRRCWVNSIEDGKDYCRWYDNEGRNTITYNRPCTRAQAGMKGIDVATGGTVDN